VLIVMDRFQVSKQATEALHNVRKRLMSHTPAADHRRLNGMRELLGKAPEGLSPEKRLELYGVLGNFPELRLAHSLVHWLRRWYDLQDIQVARDRLRAWFYRVKQTGLKNWESWPRPYGVGDGGY
jgi:hypothetical protein